MLTLKVTDGHSYGKDIDAVRPLRVTGSPHPTPLFFAFEMRAITRVAGSG